MSRTSEAARLAAKARTRTWPITMCAEEAPAEEPARAKKTYLAPTPSYHLSADPDDD